MQYCPTYYDAIAMQKHLMALTLSEIEARDSAACARAWLELEWFKREARGKPRLKAVDATALLKDARASAASRAAPIELESELFIDGTPKHALDPTVTAPPSQKPPSDNG